VAKIVIIGGGVVGSPIAYYLAQAGNAGDVVVIEPDPTYEVAATPRATGGIRQLYTVPEHIRMSQYGHEIYGQFDTLMGVDGEPARIDFHRAGFLWLGSGKKRHRRTDGELAGADRARRPGRTARPQGGGQASLSVNTGRRHRYRGLLTRRRLPGPVQRLDGILS